jgi:hypothetical protein
VKEIILPSLPLVLILVLFLPLAISLAFMFVLRHIVWSCLWRLRPLLVVSLLFYIEDLLI